MKKEKKDKLFTMKVTAKEKADLERLATKEGHNTVSGFLMWLIRQYKDKKLIRK